MFWNKLCELCNQFGTTPTAVCRELDISKGCVTRWKNGSIPHGTTLQSIANYFGVTAEYLLSDQQETQLATAFDPLRSAYDKADSRTQKAICILLGLE